MITQIGICQNQIRLFGFLWRVQCGERLKYVGRESLCPSCGWVRPPLPKTPKPVKIPAPTYRNGCPILEIEK